MDADQLAETTMDPRHRMLRRVNIAEVEAAERVFDLLMGSAVAPRKDFIVSPRRRAGPRAHRRLTPHFRSGNGGPRSVVVRETAGTETTAPQAPARRCGRRRSPNESGAAAAVSRTKAA